MRSLNIKKVRAFLAAKEKKENAALARRFLKAKMDQSRIIKMIIKKYQPTRIFVWGSLLDKRNFNSNSDIDIAVAGITDAEKFFAMLGDAMELSNFSLDIVQIEKIEPEFADIIRMKGKIVYDGAK
jgi:predicted nucleotidyltransferase